MTKAADATSTPAPAATAPTTAGDASNDAMEITQGDATAAVVADGPVPSPAASEPAAVDRALLSTLQNTWIADLAKQHKATLHALTHSIRARYKPFRCH